MTGNQWLRREDYFYYHPCCSLIYLFGLHHWFHLTNDTFNYKYLIFPSTLPINKKNIFSVFPTLIVLSNPTFAFRYLKKIYMKGLFIRQGMATILVTTIVFCFVATEPSYGQTTIQPTNGQDRINSFAAKRSMVENSSIKVPFSNIGPSAMGGRVVDLAVNPTKTIEFFVAYATGGLWHTKNNGQSFAPVFDSADVIGLGAVAVHWPSGTIWLGTGEANGNRSSYSGTGIYKSTDTGKTWHYMGLPESHHIGCIVVHPTNPNTVWVAVSGHLYSSNEERGVYKTTDGGNTWKRVLYVDEFTGAIDMNINPANSDELYACMWHRTRSAWNFEEAGAGSGIYKSTDGGNNWQNISGPNSGLPGNGALGRCGIAIFPGDTRVLYLLADNQTKIPTPEPKDAGDYSKSYRPYHFKRISKEQFAQLDDNKLDSFLLQNKLGRKYNAKSLKAGVAAGTIAPTALYTFIVGGDTSDSTKLPAIGVELYRSNDAGISWEKVAGAKISNTFGPIGYYFGKLTVSPYNENKVLLLGINPMLSIDGGKSFNTIGKSNTHADFHSAWMNPADDGHIIVGNDGGVNITYDNGMNWFKANTPAVGQVYSLSVDNGSPFKVYAGFQDNGVWCGKTTSAFYSEDLGDPRGYKRIGGGDGMMVQADPRDNKTIYLGVQFGKYWRTHADTGGLLMLKPDQPLEEPNFRFNWLSPMLISKHIPDVIYLASNHLHRSLRKGADMQTISPDLTYGKKNGDVPNGTITCIDESPRRFGHLLAGTDDGRVQLSTDGGYNWRPIDSALPKGLWVSRVVASGYSDSRIYVTLNGYRNDHFKPYVFVSNDLGNTWQSISNNLPLEPVNVLREDPINENILYLGTDGGCYVSQNQGDSWEIWNKGLPVSVPVHDIAIHKGQNQILLGTHGRSIYIAPLNKLNGGKAELQLKMERPSID
jgi:photosystem II stability/assembly factor-like uncharacterized protein